MGVSSGAVRRGYRSPVVKPSLPRDKRKEEGRIKKDHKDLSLVEWSCFSKIVKAVERAVWAGDPEFSGPCQDRQ